MRNCVKFDSGDNRRFVDANYPQEFWSNSGLTERKLEFTGEPAAGTVEEIFFQGIRVFHSHSRLAKPAQIDVHNDFSNVQMHFMLEGNSHALANGKKLHGLQTSQYNLMYSPNFEGSYALESKTIHNFEVMFTETFFQKLMNDNYRGLDNVINNIEKKQAIAASPTNLPINPAMKAIIYEIIHCQRSGLIKRLFLEAKILELFMLHIEQMETQLHQSKTSLKSDDIEKVYAVREMLEKDLCGDFSLLSLSRSVGLNDFKLKKGFKELFGTTVFGYLNELRMNYARHLLLAERKTVQEVADTLGYSQSHHFSHAFKKKFGYLPGILKD